MPSPTQIIGSHGEAMAKKFLLEAGFRFLENNFRTRFGELDLIMMEGDEVVFVEVKLRKSNAFGYPEQMVNWRKKRHLLKAAHIYLDRRNITDRFWRFDTIAITGNIDPFEIRHFKDTIRVDR